MIYFAKWKVVLVLVVCLSGLLFAMPNFVGVKNADALPDWLPKKQVSLGLDLQGGSHLLLEVDSRAVVREYLDAMVDIIRSELRKERIRYSGLGVTDDGAQVTIKDATKVDVARKLLKDIDPNATASADGNKVVLTLSEKALRERKASAVQQSIEIVRRRVDETGTREPTIQRQGEDRILVQLPGVEDPDRIKRLLGKTAKMSFHLVDQRNSVESAMAGRIPPGSWLLPSDDESEQGRMYLIRKRVMVSGDTLVDSQPSYDSRTNEPVVTFRFDSSGAKRFGTATSKNVGKLFAIVLDRKVISAPVIREPILGGSGQISGSFTIQGAQDLALLLRAGALPAPLKILEERSVGPGLGADSIAAGKIASIIGIIAVV
ncbi:MAG: protein translocase subunit SecD, partial [Alphaproteobacteria bacterium]|nr:protein translocase subunit SecD [Alphaproteobacteria bacterium]